MGPNVTMSTRGSVENSQCREPKETPPGWRLEHGVGQGLDPARPGRFLGGLLSMPSTARGMIWACSGQICRGHHVSEPVLFL